MVILNSFCLFFLFGEIVIFDICKNIVISLLFDINPDNYSINPKSTPPNTHIHSQTHMQSYTHTHTHAILHTHMQSYTHTHAIIQKHAIINNYTWKILKE